jgi:nucleoside-diphosphate-sugar epimerase
MTPNQKKSVLITGATGFVGGALVEALLKEGCSVACLVRSTSNTSALRNFPVQLIMGDLHNLGVMRQALSGIDSVIHVAGAIKAANREGYFRANQIGTRNLLEAAAESGTNLKRFVYVSSLAAAGPSPEDRSLTENEKPNPISWYGESKLQSELEVLKFAKAFPVTILRPSAVYGPRDRETLLIFRMIKQGYFFTPGRFARRFSLIHVDDLVSALIRASELDTPSGEVFFVSRPETYTWGEVGQAIADVLDRKYRWIRFPQWIAEMAGLAGDMWSKLTGRPATVNSQKIKELVQPSWICDSSKARESLGFDPKIDLETGMRDTVAWYLKEGWL